MSKATMRCTLHRAGLAVARGLSASRAGGQDQPTPPPAPTPTEKPGETDPDKAAPPAEPDRRTIEEIRRDLRRDDPTASTERAEAPTENTAVEFNPLVPPRGRLLPEGSYLMSRAGRFTRTESLGVLHFLPDPDPSRPSQQNQAMILLPCRVTERIESNLHEATTSGPIEVSGRVYVYDGRNYLMPTTNPFRTGTTVSTNRTGLVREGAFIVSRLARISRSGAGGEWMVTFDSDRTGQMDPPMVLIPCRLLERLIRTAQAEGDAARIIISGQVYAYHDVNYLLPTVMLRPLASENLSP